MNERNLKLHRNKLIIGVILFLIIISISSIFIINAQVKTSVSDRIITVDETSLVDPDCILILGAGVWGDGRPSYMLKDRLIQGIELYKRGVSDRLLMSGDHGRKEYDEVNVMKEYAIDKGVPSEHVFMDHAGFSTYESLYRARDIFEVEKVIIITQKYHMYRALYIADKLGLEAYGVTSEPELYPGQGRREIREVLARIKDFFYVVIEPEPTYLGETIPVNGNGNLTND